MAHVKSSTDWQAVWDAAKTAAKQAADAVGARNGDGGACGYAWVSIQPARGPFITWCKRMNAQAGDQRNLQPYGELFGYKPGWEIWGPSEYRGQSLDAKEAGTAAFVKVLCAAGVNASWQSRLD